MDYNKFLRFVSRRLIVLGVAMCMFPIANCMAQGAKEKNAGVVESPVPAKLTIVGRVTDSAGEPLAGASVIVKGSSTGVSTDTDGTFTLRFTKNKTKDNIIVVSFIGMQSQEIAISSSTRLEVRLQEDSHLDAVVVNGFYSQPKETFTGAATTISGEELIKVAPTNLITGLVSLTPGMVLVENNAAGSNPNAIPSLLIRGANTLIENDSEEGVNNPLIVLDGVEITMADLYDLDVFDIERVDVLKDASATILYGEKGANGVIVIERKKAEQGKLRLNYNFLPRFSIPDLSSFNLTNPEQKLELERLAGLYDKADGSLDEAYDYKLQRIRAGVGTDWLHAPLRIPFSHNHSMSLSSRADALDFRASANLNDNYGVMKGDNRRSSGVNFNITYHLRDKLTLSYKSSFSMNNSVDSPYGNYSQYSKMNPYETIRDENGEFIKKYNFNPFGSKNNGDPNPLYDAELSSFSKGKTHSFVNSISGRWNIMKNFYVTGQGNLGLNWGAMEKYVSPMSAKEIGMSMEKRGSYSFSSSSGLTTSGKIVINYGRSLDTKGTMFRISAGSNINYSRRSSSSARAVGFLKDELSDLSFAIAYENGKPTGKDIISTQVGFFVNGNFSLWNRYFIDLSYRTSGSSKFGSNNSFAPFWALGGGWNIHREGFAKNLKWLNSLVLRYSAGYTGSVSFDYYQAKTIYKYNSKYEYYSGIGARPDKMGNPDLKWQRTFNNNLGLSGSFLDNRLNISLDFYSNTTYDMLMPVELPPSVGTKSMNINFGQINNKGIDLSLSAQIIRKKDLFWSMTITGGHVMDEIRKITSALKSNPNANDPSKPRVLYQEGHSQFDIFAMRSAGIDPATGKEIFIKRNGEYTYNYNTNERVAVGNSNPILKGSLMNTFRWKGFSFSISTSYTFGGDYYNTTLQQKVEHIDPYHNVDVRAFTDRWKKPGDLSRYLSLANNETGTIFSERFVERRNELYISSVQFTYEFAPKKITKIGLRKLALGIGLSDLGYISTVRFERGTSYPYCRSINLIFRPTF